MKAAFKIISLLAVTFSLTLYSGCKKPEPTPPSIQDQKLTLLTKSLWKVSAVTKDNVDVKSPDYTSFTISITGTAGQLAMPYTCAGNQGTKYPWAKSGTLTFDDTSPATLLTREDSTPVTYSVSDTQLDMSFTYNGSGTTFRETVVTGVWHFTFTH